MRLRHLRASAEPDIFGPGDWKVKATIVARRHSAGSRSRGPGGGISYIAAQHKKN
jgi:hypothetical protein